MGVHFRRMVDIWVYTSGEWWICGCVLRENGGYVGVYFRRIVDMWVYTSGERWICGCTLQENGGYVGVHFKRMHEKRLCPFFL